MLTDADCQAGPHYHVIGVRADGDRLILQSCRSRDRADAQAEAFRQQLEDYAEIVVEGDCRRGPQQFWTVAERDWLASAWRRLPAAWVASQLGRSEFAVTSMAKRLGLCRRRKRLREYGDQIRRLHDLGQTSNAIARALELGAASVRSWLYRHGLVPRGKDPAVRSRLKRAEYLRRSIGLAEARLASWAAQAAGRGWPQVRTPRQADVLDVLESGPKSAAAVAEALGLPRPSRGSQRMVTFLRYLETRGLVVDATDPAICRPRLYRLADGVCRRLPAIGEGA